MLISFVDIFDVEGSSWVKLAFLKLKQRKEGDGRKGEGKENRIGREGREGERKGYRFVCLLQRLSCDCSKQETFNPMVQRGMGS